ncbi:hypothetical protein [Ralstonia flaminis]|uniref:Uncharacterized protein n=1 Tax=Ralstonia flaminis TaxID=3058597 RepID=A0ABM9KAW3_9RALS|nr:hypothetical protein [Ralstonia sp. LMG 18101]CAJ0819892.1 hypothetical protein LMG18101_04097 [Ralstonia sp. LMG 18101]
MEKISIEPTLSHQSNDAYQNPIGAPKMEKVAIEPTLSFQSNDAYQNPIGAPLK